MKIKNIIALLMVVVLSLTVFCACNDKVTWETNGTVDTNGAEDTNGGSLQTGENDGESICESEGGTTGEESDYVDDENDSSKDGTESETVGAYEEEDEWEGPIITN